MLPYTPLHHLLLAALDFPVVATSGNLSDEPICIDEREALERLRGIADAYLVHDRPIVRHVDDSIVRVMREREIVLRRARGYAPLPVRVKKPLPTILAVGAHLKNSVALSLGENIFISQHIGDLETKEAYKAFANAAMDLPRLYDANPEVIACDLHPDYLSTKYAAQISSEGVHAPSIQGAAVSRPPFLKSAARKPPLLGIQHHWAHVVACMAENELEAPALGVVWDGTGYGLDGTIWGGEFLLADQKSFMRIAHFRPFLLPGGDAAVKEPRRSALGVLYEIFGKELWDRPELLRGIEQSERALLGQMLAKNVNAPPTSSVGRLFDAVAALIGLRDRTSFEGQAAMELEFAAETGVSDSYSFVLLEGETAVVDWQPTILQLLDDIYSGASPGVMSAKFHNMLAETVVRLAQKTREPKIVLTGGCFQNRYLTERTVSRLLAEGFRPYWHQRVPPNDGGIALGQAVAANWAMTHGQVL
jgi:hydrogenase maturation protein HypF